MYVRPSQPYPAKLITTSCIDQRHHGVGVIADRRPRSSAWTHLSIRGQSLNWSGDGQGPGKGVTRTDGAATYVTCYLLEDWTGDLSAHVFYAGEKDPGGKKTW